MSEADLRKWDERYRTGSYAGRKHATALLAEIVADLPCGRALDVACGTGRNAVFLAERGFAVDAIDVSEIGLERARADAAARGVRVRFIAGDLDHGLDALVPQDRRYDLIVLVRYANARIVPELARRLGDGGVLVVEQHLATSAEVAGPTSARFRLAPNALLESAAGLRVLLYREGLVEDPDGRTAALAQLVACRGRPPFEPAGTLPFEPADTLPFEPAGTESC